MSRPSDKDPAIAKVRRCAVPTVKLDETLEMYYEEDDFTDPWRTPDARASWTNWRLGI